MTEATEHDMLLPASPHQPESAQSRLRGLSPAYYIIPVVLIARFCAELPSTTLLEILRQLVCRIYWDTHADIPMQGEGFSGDDRCRVAEVQQLYSAAVQAQVLLKAVGSFAMYGPINRLSGRLGRKPVLLGLVIASLLGDLFILAAGNSPGMVQILLLAMWIVTTALSGTMLYDLLADMYVVDSTSAAERTSVLSIVYGATIVGNVPAYGIGGFLTVRTASNFTVYWVSAAMNAGIGLYVLCVLPESLSSEQRALLRRRRIEEQTRSSKTMIDRRTLAGGIYSVCSAVLHPIAALRPRRDPVTHRLNLRLLWCGLHMFFSQLGSGYSIHAILIYLTSLGNRPDNNGYLLSVTSMSAVFSLLVLTPLMMKSIRPAYERHFMKQDARSSADETASRLSTPRSSGTQVEILVAILGWTIDIIVMLSVPRATSEVQMLWLVFAYGVGAFRTPTTRSVVVASVDRSRGGDALSATQMAGSVGSVLSSIVLGSVLSATISTTPSAVFWTYGAIELVGIAILCLIRDSDRPDYHDE